MNRFRNPLLLNLLLACVVLTISTVQAQEFHSAEDNREILEINLEEQVDSNLVEFKILVTDKRGNPIRDLTPEDVTVFEGKETRKIAFLEPVSGGVITPSSQEKGPSPSRLFGETADADTEAVEIPALPPRPIRRIVIAFDVRNSKRNVRERWKESALEWIETKMQPDDQVAVVLFRSFPDWVIPFTGDAGTLAKKLDVLSIQAGTGDRDRARDMSSLVNDIKTNCTDPGSPNRSRRFATDNHQSGSSGLDEQSCAYHFVEATVQGWDAEAKETIDTLRTLTGQLAAIPGRKAILMFSEGMVADAATVGVSAMVAAFGIEKIDMNRVIWQLKRNSTNELNSLHHVAKSAEVAFYTFDTRQGDSGGFGGDLEQAHKTRAATYGINPWNEMLYETRGTLQVLAKETGGESFQGRKKLPQQMTAAADSFYGLYSLGFYRAEAGQPVRKIRVEINNRRTKVRYPEKIAISRHKPQTVQMHITLGRPQMTATGRKQRIPVTLSMEIDALPLRRGSGGRGCQIGALLQAVQPDGTIEVESLELITVVIPADELKELAGKRYDHQTSIEVPLGAYRIRARLSDDRQKILGDRSVDVTVENGEIRAGLHSPVKAGG